MMAEEGRLPGFPLVFRRSEAIIQFELYRLLCEAGFHVIPEYRHWPDNLPSGCRFDLVLHDGVDVFVICEVKKGIKAETGATFLASYQYVRYAASGVPVICVTARTHLPSVVAALVAQYPAQRFLGLPTFPPLHSPRRKRPKNAPARLADRQPPRPQRRRHAYLTSWPFDD